MTPSASPPNAAGSQAVRVFVAPDGNAFMTDIAAWLVDAARCSGWTAGLVTDRLPAPDGSINLVVAPHEFYILRDDDDAAVRAAARCSIPVCTEQPGTPWFTLTAGLCEGSPLVVDINELGALALRDEGFDVHHLRLGGTPMMVHAPAGAGAGDGPRRDIDVLFLGGATPRRNRVLAGLAPVLWDRASQVLTFSFSRPVTGDEPGLVFGDEKYELLARSTMLVNVHRGDAAVDDGDPAAEYFEWARMVEAMANGCLVVTEPSVGHQPLVAGEHFVECRADDLPATIAALLEDSERCTRISENARAAVNGPLALEHTMSELLAIAGPLVERTLNADDVSGGGRRARRRGFVRTRTTPVVRAAPSPLLPVFTPYRGLRRDLYDQWLAEIAHRRELGRFRSLLDHGDPDHVGRTTTPAWDADVDSSENEGARVSVVVTVFDYADVVVETLDSIVRSRDVVIEIVIVDDASNDASCAVVREWMDRHGDVPTLLLMRAANQGLARARNLAIDHTRTDLVMIMDADNLVYPTCLRRLAEALAADPSAAFAYSTLEAFGSDPGLRSAQGWHVPWLCDANYIDAQAMVRRATFERLGGYRVDETMYGWEDWELWLQIASDGDHGVHVPQMLGRYRTQPGSMVSMANLAAPDLRAGLVAQYPTLPWPENDRELLR